MTAILHDFMRDCELAKELNIKQSTLTIWRCRGRGPSFTKIGRTCWYKRADVDAWLATQCHKTDDSAP